MRSGIFSSVLFSLTCSASLVLAADCCDPESPFREGEQYPDVPATCQNIGSWADRAPQTDNRISLGISGKLSEVHSDGVLAYLIMCEPSGTQVMCVTCNTNGLEPGDVVVFGGGYSRLEQKRILLDPCLASRD